MRKIVEHHYPVSADTYIACSDFEGCLWRWKSANIHWKEHWYETLLKIYLENEFWQNKYIINTKEHTVEEKIEKPKCVEGIYIPIWRDGYYQRETEKRNGVYLIGQTTFNPYTDKKYYAIKFGGTSNAKTRMRSYDTDNPNYFKIGFLDCEDSYVPTELYYRSLLKKVAIKASERNTEWFYVDKETYLAICENGFKYFDEMLDK